MRLRHEVVFGSRAAILLAAALTLAACQEDHMVAPRRPPTYMAQAISCSVSKARKTFACASGSASGAGTRIDALMAARRHVPVPPKRGVNAAIIGGQDVFVSLTSEGVTYDVVTDQLSANVEIQNLTSLTFGLFPGGESDPDGIQVYFSSPPTNGVTVTNALC